MKGLFKLLMVLLALLAGAFPPVFAQDETMSETATDALAGMSTLFAQNLNTSQTLGKPFEAGEYTIIPVVAKGLGFGLGTKMDAKEFEAGGNGPGKNEVQQKDRIGLGGGGFVKPVALIMIKKNGEFKVVKLCEGLFAQFAKYMLPAIGSMVRKTIMTISAEKMKHESQRHKDRRKVEKNIEKIELKKAEAANKAPKAEKPAPTTAKPAPAAPAPAKPTSAAVAPVPVAPVAAPTPVVVPAPAPPANN